MSAHLNAIDWYRPIGPPNARRGLRVRERRVEARLREADGERGDRDATVVEDAEERLEPFAAHAEQVVLGHAAPVERELVGVGRVPAHLPVRRQHREARRARVDDDVGDLARHRCAP